MRYLAQLLLLSSRLWAQVVDGTVQNATTGAPLAGLRVTSMQRDKSSYHTVSDAQGSFRFDGVAAGDYLAGFEKAGFGAPLRDSTTRRPFQVAWAEMPVRLEAKMDTLARIVSDRAPNLVRGVIQTPEKGEFVITYITPGRYRLCARAPLHAKPLDDEDGQKKVWVRTRFPAVAERSAARIVVAGVAEWIGQDIPLRAVPAHGVRGRILSDAGQPLRDVLVRTIPPDEIFIREFQYQTHSADGKLRLENVPSGTYRLSSVSPGRHYYLASIQIGTRQVLGTYLGITSTLPPVIITYRTDGGRVLGTVEECGKAVVVLVSQNPNLQYNEFTRRATCDGNHRFEIGGIRPGKYFALASDREPGLLDISAVSGDLVRPSEATTLKVIERGEF